MILLDGAGHLNTFMPFKYRKIASMCIPNITFIVIKGYFKKLINSLLVDNLFFFAVKDANSFSFSEKYSIKIDKVLLLSKLLNL